MHQPAHTFLGYLAREICTMDKYLAAVPEQRAAAKGITELCSVSECISQAYRDFKQWGFNPSGCFTSPERALETVPAERRSAVRVFAYRLFPLEFAGDAVRDVPVTTLLNTEPGDLPDTDAAPTFRSLGYDAVSMRPASSNMMFAFDCSPLSCNSEFQGRSVNDHCLLDSWDAAVKAAQDFAKQEPEPGPYCIVEVLEGPRPR